MISIFDETAKVISTNTGPTRENMQSDKLKRIFLVYMVLIPVMWLLTEAVWGGLHGALLGLKLGKALRNPQTSEEFTAFMKQHGLSEKATQKESEEWFGKLTAKERGEFQGILQKSVDIKNVIGFGSTFAVCVIVFGAVGFIGGIFTRTWIYVGILPLISFLLNNPIFRFGAIHDMPFGQKAAIVLASQFLACYIFSYAGTMLSMAISKRRHDRINKPDKTTPFDHTQRGTSQ